MIGVYSKTDTAILKTKLKELKAIQSFSIDDKTELTNQIIKKALLIGKPCLLYSGGKDSTVLLDLLLKIKPDIRIVYNNTGMATGQHDQNIRDNTKDLNFIETQADDYKTMWETKGHYPILSKRGHTAYKKKLPGLKTSPVQCCYNLKEKYSNKIFKDEQIQVVFWGNRAAESNRRKLNFIDNGFIYELKKHKWSQCMPLQMWTKTDIISYLERNCANYKINTEHETGCKYCATDLTYTDNNLKRLLINDPKDFKQLMKTGYGKQICLLNNLDFNKIDNIVNTAPAMLTTIIRKPRGNHYVKRS